MGSELASIPTREIRAEFDREQLDLLDEFLKAARAHLPQSGNLLSLLPEDERKRRAERNVRPIAQALEIVLEGICKRLEQDRSPLLHEIAPAHDEMRMWMASQGWSSLYRFAMILREDECGGCSEEEGLEPLREGMDPRPNVHDLKYVDWVRDASLPNLIFHLSKLNGEERADGSNQIGCEGRGPIQPGPMQYEDHQIHSQNKSESLIQFMRDRRDASYDEVARAVNGPAGRATDATIRTWINRANNRQPGFTLHSRDRRVVKDD